MAQTGWTRIIGATITALALAAVPTRESGAQVPPNAAEHAAFAAFKRLDRSASLSLGFDDLSSPNAGRSLFTILDGNGDGALTAADGAPARRLLRQARQDRLSPTQFTPRRTITMAVALDTDGDGRLSLSELRPRLSGNAPLPEPTAPPRSPEVESIKPTPPCWLLTSQGTWITLPAWTPKCRLSP